MTMPAGARLGPYEIRSLLGAGGMGEVYLAWDARLAREVALKVLPASLASDPDRLRRFEQEALAIAALNHPNVLAVYDVGSHEGAPYLVSERLTGETLRERFAQGALTPRKAVEHAVQIANGLAAAHARGIVHRDLKPENVFLCRDGGSKILDFGVAKLVDSGAAGSEAETASRLTRPGTLVGTVAYMSPEQVRGLSLDARSDIFSLGIVLYEALAGRRPFEAGTAAELQTAILREEPRELPLVDARIPAALDRVVRRCLEKRPEDRFDTARDVALSLEAVLAPSGEASSAVSASSPPLRRPLVWTAGIAWTLTTAAVAALLARHFHPAMSPPSYTQLTFQRGMVASARFAPGGDVVYSAAWNGNPARVYTTRAGSLESRDLGIAGRLLSVSTKGELAVMLDASFGGGGQAGTLATVSLVGGAPRERLSEVWDADWDAAGAELAVVRIVSGRSQLEYPVGHVLYRAQNWIDSVRVLPDGRMAVFEQLDVGPRPYAIATVDARGTHSVLSSGWVDPCGAKTAVSASGEVYFAASDGGDCNLHAVSPSGGPRLVARIPGNFFLNDVDGQGRMLMVRGLPRGGVIGLPPGVAQERDLSWLDFSSSADLSADGRRVLINESAGHFGQAGGIFLRPTDGSPAVLLGSGSGLALSPDGRFVVATSSAVGMDGRVLLVPTGAGERRELSHESIPLVMDADWFPDGKRIAVKGGPSENRNRIFAWDVDTPSPPRAVTPDGNFGRPRVAPDGRFVAVRQAGAPLTIYSVEDASSRRVPGTTDEDRPVRWTADGRSLFVARGEMREASVAVDRVEIASGRRQRLRVLKPADTAGVFGIYGVQFTPDGTSYAYTFASQLGALYLAERLR